MKERADTFLFLFTKILTGFIGLFSIALQTKYLLPAEVGQFSLINGVVTALVSVMIGWIGSSALRYYFNYSKENQKEYFSTILIDWIVMVIASGLVLVLIAFVSSNLPIKNFLAFSLLFLLFSSLMEITEKMMRASKHTKIYCSLLIIESVINILFILLLHSVIASGVNLLLILKINTCGIFGITSIFVLKFLKFFRPKSFSWNLNKIFFKYGFPMVGIWGIGWLLSYSDRYIINSFLSAGEVGLYDVAYVFSERTMGVVVLSFGLAFFPMMIRVWKSKGKEETIETLKESISYYLLLSVPMVVGISFLSYHFYGTVLDLSYRDAYLVMPITCIGFLISGINNFLYKLWQLEEKTWKVLVVTTIAVAVNIGLNIIFIPIYGYIVAAITTTVSYFVAFVVTAIWVYVKFKIKIDWTKIFQILIACFGMSAFLNFSINYLDSLFGLIVVILISIVIYFGTLLLNGGLNKDLKILRKWLNGRKSNK